MKKKLLVTGIILLALAFAVGVILILRSRGAAIPFFPPPAVEEVTEGLGSAALEKSNNPLKNEIPGNPFETESNPFEGGTNAIEKSYNNPLK